MIVLTFSLLSQLSILQEQPRKDAGDITLSSSPISSSSSTLTPSSAGLQDPSLSCPGTPSPQHSKLAAMQGVGCPSPVATLKRPTALSRHASAAGNCSSPVELMESARIYSGLLCATSAVKQKRKAQSDLLPSGKRYTSIRCHTTRQERIKENCLPQQSTMNSLFL